MQFPIIIGLRRSRLVDGALFAVTALGLTGFALTPWAPFQFLLVGVATLLAALVAVFSATPRIRILRIDKDGRISCQMTGRAEFIEMHLLAGATVHPWLTVLRLVDEQHAYRVIIVPDSVAPEDFRRLRVWLRWRLEISADPDAA